MKNSAILLTVMLLSPVLKAEAKVLPGGGGLVRPGGGRLCGTQICRFGQRCVDLVVCVRAPCPRMSQCDKENKTRRKSLKNQTSYPSLLKARRLCHKMYVLWHTKVMHTEAQIRPPGKGTNPANRRKPKPVKCGDKFCQPHQRCESGLIPVPTCY
uniref:Putative conserved secreted protein fat body overexpressed n=1 Tax=Rhipicephalus microplus TaxID=6941 RepID=A0A6M2D2X4_RHIMP